MSLTTLAPRSALARLAETGSTADVLALLAHPGSLR